MGSSSPFSFLPRSSLKVLQKSVSPLKSGTSSSSQSYTWEYTVTFKSYAAQGKAPVQFEAFSVDHYLHSHDTTTQRRIVKYIVWEETQPTYFQGVIPFFEVRAAFLLLSSWSVEFTPPIDCLFLLKIELDNFNLHIYCSLHLVQESEILSHIPLFTLTFSACFGDRKKRREVTSTYTYQ